MAELLEKDYLDRRRSGGVEGFLRGLREDKILSLIDPLISGPGFELLDVGAADCRLSYKLLNVMPNINITAIDASSVLLQNSITKLPDRVGADARRLPFKDNMFDCLVTVSTFKHIQRYQEAVVEWRRVLKPGGSLIIIEPSWWIVKVGGLLKYFDLRWTPNIWSNRRYRKAFEDGGFKYKEAEYFAPLPSIPLVSRFIGMYQMISFKIDAR